MAIPPFNERGWLPDGIHDCTLEEATGRFGTFQINDRRPALWARFVEFLREARDCGLVEAVLLDEASLPPSQTPTTLTCSLWCQRRTILRLTCGQLNMVFFPCGAFAGALGSTCLLHAKVRKSTVATWASFTKSDWNPGTERAC